MQVYLFLLESCDGWEAAPERVILAWYLFHKPGFHAAPLPEM